MITHAMFAVFVLIGALLIGGVALVMLWRENRRLRHCATESFQREVKLWEERMVKHAENVREAGRQRRPIYHLDKRRLVYPDGRSVDDVDETVGRAAVSGTGRP